METTAALVIPRLADEGAHDAATISDVLDCRLEQEGAISGIKCIAMPQVDLVLRRAELVVAGECTDVEAIKHAKQVEEGSVGIDE